LKAPTKPLLAGLILTLSSLEYADDSSPEFDRYVSPTFPSGLRGGKLTGDVKVSYRIHHDGLVGDIKVQSKTDRKFSRAVVYAVSRWRFMLWDVQLQIPGSGSGVGGIPVQDGSGRAAAADDHVEAG
jgi:hypothetical protein